MMKRPEKIHDLYADKNDCGLWNSCCDKWEKFLLSKKEIFGCKLGMNHCVSGTSDCKNQSVVNGCCKYYLPKKS